MKTENTSKVFYNTSFDPALVEARKQRAIRAAATRKANLQKYREAQANPWKAIATHGPYTLWSRSCSGEPATEPGIIYVARQTCEGAPTPTSGGYFSIDAALKPKGLRQ